MANKKEETQCKHEWQHKETNKGILCLGYNNIYKQTDIYECSKCKETKENVREETSRNEPMWWR